MADNNTNILIEILQGTPHDTSACSGWPSASSCGPTTDFSEEIEELSVKLAGKFGDKVVIKHVNLDEVGFETYPIMAKVMQMGYPFPITLINGEPRFAGGIMETEIEDSIQTILEEENN